jgi:Flp pilus assembly protein TadD
MMPGISHVDSRRHTHHTALITLFLGGVTFLAFWNVWNAGFVNYDDPAYVSANPIVQRGLTAENLRWAFTTFHYRNWHPFTWLSYMFDIEMFGLTPRAFHLVNLAFHTANTLLLFFLLRRFTGVLWPCAIVAALFGWHPLHVESVAWISERKDLLSTFFALLTLWSYAEYMNRNRAGWYLSAVVLFIFALMSKAMAVTIPFLLLLIDLWPLRRLDLSSPGWLRSLRRLSIEKSPFFLLSAGASYAAFLAQGDAVMTTSNLGFTHRLQNVVVSYARYLGKTVWPSDLAVFYPHPIGGWSTTVIILSTVIVIGTSVMALRAARARPYFFVGWFWLVGTLVPVIGLVQVGSQSMADRYMYLPSIGLFIALVWGARDLVKMLRVPVLAVRIGTIAVLVAAGVLTFRQVQTWHDSLSLFGHAERVTQPNIVTLNNMIAELLAHGRTAEADIRIDTAVRLFPTEHLTWWHAGSQARRHGRLDEAAAHYQRALDLRPAEPQLHFLLAMVLQQQDKPEALHHYREAVRLDPQFALALNNLAWLLATHPDAALRRGPEAVQLSERACELTQGQQPYFLGTLAAAHAEAGNFEVAVTTAERAIAAAEARLDKPHADRTRAALALYRNKQPLRSASR